MLALWISNCTTTAGCVVGYFELPEGFGRFLIFLSAASFASAARLSLSYRDMLSG